jgi:hypothetical protein
MPWVEVIKPFPGTNVFHQSREPFHSQHAVSQFIAPSVLKPLTTRLFPLIGVEAVIR